LRTTDNGTSAFIRPCHEAYGRQSLRNQGVREPKVIAIPMERLIKMKRGEEITNPHYPRKRKLEEELQL